MTVTMSFDTIRFWNTQTGEFISQLPIEPLDGGWPRILSSEFSPDGSLYAMGSLHNDLKIWQLGSALEEISDLSNYGAELTFDSDGHKFAAANRYGAYTVIHDLNTGAEIITDYVFNMQFSALAFSPDGQILAQAGYWQEFSNLTLRFWNPATGQPFFIIDDLTIQLDYLSFKPDGTMLLSASGNGEFGLWGIETSS
jgi:WD40 repeat protein